MRQILYTYFFIGILLLSTSCSNKQYQALFQQKSLISDTSAQKNSTIVDRYHIKSQDILQIRNLQNIKYIVDDAPMATNISGGNASQGQTFKVDEDGTVALPVVGRIKVSGLTRAEAAKQIEDIYRKNLLKDPIIDLKIINLKVTLLGEVRAQGNYVLTKDKTTLVELIGEAGGLTDRANEKGIKIIRGSEINPEVIIIDLSNIRSINAQNALLQSGDIIYVSQNKRAVRNDNLQNISTLVQPALLLFNTALIVLTLIRR